MEQLNIVDGYIDKITIVGNMKRCTEYAYLVKNLHASNDPRVHGPWIDTKSYGYDLAASIKTHDSTAYVQMHRNRKRDGSSDFRIEFNPAKCNEDDMKFIFELIGLVEDKRCTRIDLCVNFHRDVMHYELLDGKNRGEWEKRDANKKTETLYRGSDQSDNFLKFYNKKKEQKDVKYRDIEHDWCRLEETIQHKTAHNYEKWSWFEGVKLVNGQPIFPEDIDPKDKGNAYAVINGFMSLSDYKRAYKDKLKEILSQVRYEEGIDVGEEIKKTSIVSDAMEVIKKLLSN
ncbi:replication initiation factor domain-containing protein [Bacillus cereus]|uniref:replication initiation factor domain-containing protein n=3 Tax=Bacillus cereus TaxID=1396 RepID=UPI002B383380